MKPKTKFQQQAVELSKKLPKITGAQVKYAFQNCFEHIAKRTKKGVITCLECGHSWQGKHTLADSVCGCTCPDCGQELKVCDTRKFSFNDSQYFGMMTTFGDMQVLRCFSLTVLRRVGKPAQYDCHEVVQRWIAPDGRHATLALPRKMSVMYYDRWDYGSSLEIRREHRSQDIAPARYYPHSRFIPELERNGFKGEYHRIAPFNLFRAILSDSRAETLLKAGQPELLRYFISRKFEAFNDVWPSVKICIRNGYTVKDAQIWIDYINLLRFFGKDLHNAKYVCPADLNAEHDRYVRKKHESAERERMEKARKKAVEDEADFHRMKSRYFGLCLTDGDIQVRMLESVEEVMREGDTMKHCVFACGYHLDPDSLILSACVNGQKVETVEFSLSRMEVIQCRGKHNRTTEYHDRIIELVNKNRLVIRKRLAA
jgi:hypothetical protein